jgi:hypothetical protein
MKELSQNGKNFIGSLPDSIAELQILLALYDGYISSLLLILNYSHQISITAITLKDAPAKPGFLLYGVERLQFSERGRIPECFRDFLSCYASQLQGERLMIEAKLLDLVSEEKRFLYE